MLIECSVIMCHAGMTVNAALTSACISVSVNMRATTDTEQTMEGGRMEDGVVGQGWHQRGEWPGTEDKTRQCARHVNNRGIQEKSEDRQTERDAGGQMTRLTHNGHEQDVLSGDGDLLFAQDALEELVHMLGVGLHAFHVSRVASAL